MFVDDPSVIVREGRAPCLCGGAQSARLGPGHGGLPLRGKPVGVIVSGGNVDFDAVCDADMGSRER